ncbi:MAG: preprotein translocase subunit SecG, partial [Mesorhizobium sp.]
METVLIVIHLMVVLALVGVVLLQRSEGGGLGIGGGSGFMTARGAANALTRATAILAAAFFATSLTLSLVARYGEKPIDILDRVPASSSNAGKG